MQEVDLSVITLKCNGCMEYIEAKGQCVIARCVHIFCEWRAAAGGGGGQGACCDAATTAAGPDVRASPSTAPMHLGSNLRLPR